MFREHSVWLLFRLSVSSTWHIAYDLSALFHPQNEQSPARKLDTLDSSRQRISYIIQCFFIRGPHMVLISMLGQLMMSESKLLTDSFSRLIFQCRSLSVIMTFSTGVWGPHFSLNTRLRMPVFYVFSQTTAIHRYSSSWVVAGLAFVFLASTAWDEIYKVFRHVLFLLRFGSGEISPKDCYVF